jgi:hypothetical protein
MVVLPKRKYRVSTNSRHSLPVAENLLERHFNPEVANFVRLAQFGTFQVGDLVSS